MAHKGYYRGAHPSEERLRSNSPPTCPNPARCTTPSPLFSGAGRPVQAADQRVCVDDMSLTSMAHREHRAHSRQGEPPRPPECVSTDRRTGSDDRPSSTEVPVVDWSAASGQDLQEFGSCTLGVLGDPTRGLAAQPTQPRHGCAWISRPPTRAVQRGSAAVLARDVSHVGDSASENLSSTSGSRPVRYVDDSRIWAPEIAVVTCGRQGGPGSP